MLPIGVCNPAVRVGGFEPTVGKQVTTCFADVILVPLPTWFLIILGIPLFLTLSRPSGAIVETRSRSCGARIVQGLYGVLVFALLLMDVLEIVRLALSKSGIGLLPFSLAGTLVALGMLAARYKGHKNRKGVAAILVVYWILLTGFQAAKVSALISVEKSAKARGDKGPSKYPNSDKSLDNYVILGLYAVFTFYEAGQLVRRSTRTADVYEQNDSPQGLVGKDGY